MRGFHRLAIGTTLSIAVVGCNRTPPEPEPEPKEPPVQKAEASETPKFPGVSKPGKPGGDPMGGKFTLEQATAGLPGQGELSATLSTSKGKLTCKLYSDKAPNTVANFVGLARGKRPWKSPSGEWVERPAYDGTTFHRIIKGFMIQGGDAHGTGRGDPGYVIPDEVWPGARHDRRGLLCMANRGPNTNGAQFFILDGPAPHLDSGYTIFGECGPGAVIQALASVPTRGDRPEEPPTITKVEITRGGKSG